MLPAVSLPRGPLPKRVLLAEDDRHARLLWKRALSEQGFQVLEAGNGVDAWKLIHSAPLGGLILDMRLPGMHGLEILTRMQEQNKVLPVVVCSALGQVQDDPVLRGYPLLQFLLKPVEPEQITGALEDLRAQVAG
jgi:DNA-binding response OmpR family regulator